MRDYEVGLLRGQGFVAGASGCFEDEFEEGLGDEAWRGEEDRFVF